ncbi:unnamed protein product [Lasius platythorax]|uniref:Uncharacterized protein n=1 Tax=Lasius platythorax TaxID=488582 RepID=A0AAV2NMU9_9HYME
MVIWLYGLVPIIFYIISAPTVIPKTFSQMFKTPEVQLDDTLSYINSDKTPGKSILKKSNAERKLDFETENFGSSDDVNEISALIEED